MNEAESRALQNLPSIHELLAHPAVAALISRLGHVRVAGWARDAVDVLREELSRDGRTAARTDLLKQLAADILAAHAHSNSHSLARVINATGVILHTGLGRAPLGAGVLQAIADSAAATNLEVDLATGQRRYRGYQLRDAFVQLTGAEEALVVNNNAAATLLTLQAICRGSEVIISRGQLIEIGGSFRLPEIFELSGAVLREVGTTNRTRISDYQAAIGPDTAAILRVHPSNYRVMGFAETPEIRELTALAHEKGILAIDDIGSGALLDMTRYGLPREPTFGESIAAGADLVLGSGDKLLGGPQCGIILGSADLIHRMRQHPLARTLRIDKLTLAALFATLETYRRGTAEREIPTLALLATPVEQLRQRTEAIANALREAKNLTVTVRDGTAPVGGGSLPTAELPTVVLQIDHGELNAEVLAGRLRQSSPRIYGRIQDGCLLLDLRSVLTDDDATLIVALRAVN